MPIALLPYLDEHATVIAAETDDFWRGLAETLDRSFSRPGMAGYTRLVGCADCAASGPRPHGAGRAPAPADENLVESADTGQSMSRAASTCAWAARSMRSKVPSARRRKRVCSVAHGPYRSGTSRQAVPVRNFPTIPLSTSRSSSHYRSRSGTGSGGPTNSHSASDSSRRRIAPPRSTTQDPLKDTA
jgi:hypothetical protein